MAAPSETAGRTRRRKKVNSSHVAPRGQRARVARRPEPPVPVSTKVPVRRRRERRKPPVAPETMTQPRSSQFDRVLSARMVSAFLIFALGVVLLIFFRSDAFYVRQIEVGGLDHLSAGEVFTLSGVAAMHLFWIDPADVRARIMESPSVADARVSVGWPPHPVQIEVQEREPALIWEQAGVRIWIDVRGRVMPQRTDLEGLLRVVVDGVDGPIGPNVEIPQDVVDGALQLKELAPGLEVLRYDPVEGLGYQDSRGWRVWFGTGANMPSKMTVYNAIVADLTARGIQPEYVDVGDVDAPYYKVWWAREEDTGEEAGVDETAPAATEQ